MQTGSGPAIHGQWPPSSNIDPSDAVLAASLPTTTQTSVQRGREGRKVSMQPSLLGLVLWVLIQEHQPRNTKIITSIQGCHTRSQKQFYCPTKPSSAAPPVGDCGFPVVRGHLPPWGRNARPHTSICAMKQCVETQRRRQPPHTPACLYSSRGSPLCHHTEL